MVECEERCWEIRVNPYLSWDKDTRTDDHGPKSGRLTDGHTGENGTRTKKLILAQTRQNCVFDVQ